MARILVADDEPSIREALCLCLSRDGHTVCSCEDGISAWRSLEGSVAFELAILDIVMPGLEGTAVLSRLRLSGSSIPVIMLSSRDEELDRLGGFALGADDYIGKPFSLRELSARVTALLRRAGANVAPGITQTATPSLADDEAQTQTGLSVDTTAHRAWFGKRELELTLIEFRLLEALHSNAGAALSRSQLVAKAWPQESWTDERLVDSHIKRLRHKLKDSGAPDELIRTIYGLGYRMEIQR